jgi:heptaprenyl diphosphate synthase
MKQQETKTGAGIPDIKTAGNGADGRTSGTGRNKAGNAGSLSSRTRRLVFGAMLAGIALVIFVVELQIPPLTPIPGIKLGLANVVTLFAMFAFGPADALAVLTVRILLGALVLGSPSAFIYSFAGGTCSYLVMLLLRRILDEKQIFVCGVFCAVAHNAGQVLVAFFLTQTPAILLYFPVLMAAGVVTGLFTGFAAGFAVKQIKKIKKTL